MKKTGLLKDRVRKKTEFFDQAFECLRQDNQAIELN